jgi:hypothetical protein
MACTFHQTPHLRFGKSRYRAKRKGNLTAPFPHPRGPRRRTELLQASETELSTRYFSLLRNTISREAVTDEFGLFPVRRCGADRIGSPVVGVGRGSERGVDEGRVAETAAEHGLCLIRHGRRRRRRHGSWNVGALEERVGRQSARRKLTLRFPFGAGSAKNK